MNDGKNPPYLGTLPITFFREPGGASQMQHGKHRLGLPLRTASRMILDGLFMCKTP